MRIDVALLPDLVKYPQSVFAVVDVLRASSTIVTLLERGVPAVIPAAGVDEAMELRERLSDHLLCGERDGLPPPGFDFGNSPAEFGGAALDGRPVILATSNGTRILNQLAGAPAVVVGALTNREAAARALLSLAAERGSDITVVSASAPDGRSVALEDALGAGAIVDAALRLQPAPRPTDAARLALYAFRARASDLASALVAARHGAELIEAGFEEDVKLCARLDVSTVVPLLGRDGNGWLTLRAL